MTSNCSLNLHILNNLRPLWRQTRRGACEGHQYDEGQINPLQPELRPNMECPHLETAVDVSPAFVRRLTTENKTAWTCSGELWLFPFYGPSLETGGWTEEVMELRGGGFVVILDLLVSRVKPVPNWVKNVYCCHQYWEVCVFCLFRK